MVKKSLPASLLNKCCSLANATNFRKHWPDAVCFAANPSNSFRPGNLFDLAPVILLLRTVFTDLSKQHRFGDTPFLSHYSNDIVSLSSFRLSHLKKSWILCSHNSHQSDSIKHRSQAVNIACFLWSMPKTPLSYGSTLPVSRTCLLESTKPLSICSTISAFVQLFNHVV